MPPQAAAAMLPAMHRSPPPYRPATHRPGRALWLLLWLLVALLPLRPVASWAMAPGPGPAQPAAHQGDGVPCHGHAAMAAHAGAQTDTPVAMDDSAGTGAHPAPAAQTAPCSACDLCHAAMAGPVLAGLGALPAPRALPAPLLQVAARLAPADGLFRPPRA